MRVPRDDAVPGWVISPQNLTGNSYVPANRRYTLDWLRGAKERWNISAVDYLGFWNEPDDNQFAPVSYIKALRGDLDRAGWAQTKHRGTSSLSRGAPIICGQLPSAVACRAALQTLTST